MEREGGQSHIENNKNSIMSKKSIALEMSRQNKEIFTKNIPMYMKKYGFTRE